MTGDEYLVKRILELEQENSELKSKLKEDKVIYFVFHSGYMKDSKFLVELKDGKTIVSNVEKEK